MVQSSDLTRIRKARDAKGLEPCKVPCAEGLLDKEYHLGAGTGDYGCSVCGASYFRVDEYDAWRAARTRLPSSG